MFNVRNVTLIVDSTVSSVMGGRLMFVVDVAVVGVDVAFLDLDLPFLDFDFVAAGLLLVDVV